MRKQLILISLLLLPLLLQAEGRRIDAGDTFLEPLIQRDSILIADPVRYGMVLRNIPERTPLALTVFQVEEGNPLQALGPWQLDSMLVSKRKETPRRYDIRVSQILVAPIGATYELPPLMAVVDGDTLVFRPSRLEVKELPVDMETFEPHDIKPQIRFPVTLEEILPWLAGFWALVLGVAAVVCLLLMRRRGTQAARPQDPPHITALRKLEHWRGDKYWAPDKQKAFYSGVTDALREYIAARYGVGAMEMTTAEIFRDMSKTDVPKDLYEEMKALFERADFVKFAKYVAPQEDNASVLPQAVRFVTETYQQEIADQVGNDGPVMPGEDRASHQKES